MPLLVLLTALGSWLGFANSLAAFPAAVLMTPLGLAWIAFRAHSVKKALAWGFAAGWLASLAVIWWIALPVGQYGGLPWFLAWPCPLGVAVVLGSYHAVWCALMHISARRLPVWALCLAGGVFWFCLEHASSHLVTGFPWTALASALAPWPWAAQPASLVGTYGLSGLVAALATALVLLNTARPARWIAFGLLLFLGLFGPLRLALSPLADTPGDGESRRLLLVQGSVEQGVKWNREYQSSTVDRYREMTLAALAEAGGADLVLWPETAMPFYLQDITPYSTEVLSFARQTGTWLVTGAPAYEMPTGADAYTLYNRAFLLSPEGRIRGTYDKEHLVPFGEYVPLADILPLGKLTHGVGDYAPGRSAAPLRGAGLNMGPLICYEAIFPGLAQARVAAGADVLVNLSNDAWFGRTPAPRQHLSHARMRCVEQGRAMARCTNNGLTVCIDPLGRITGTIPQYDPGVLACRVAPRHLKTLFHRCYDYLIPTGYALALLLLAAAHIRGRRPRGPGL